MGIGRCSKVLMLPSEDLYPQGNNKEDGLSGHLVPHCRGEDLHKTLFVSQLQPPDAREWSRDHTRNQPRPITGMGIPVHCKWSRVWPICKLLWLVRADGNNPRRVRAGGMDNGQRRKWEPLVEGPRSCPPPHTGLEASLEQGAHQHNIPSA